MKLIGFTIIILLFTLSCSRYQRVGYGGEIITYQYEIQVVESQGNSVEGAKIDYTIKEDNQRLIEKSVITSFDGIVRAEVKASKKRGAYMYYEITKNGYCIEEGKIAALGKESSEGIRKISKKIYLTESTFDYLPFQIEIVGLNRKPVSDVWVDYKIIQKKEKIASNRGLTDERGIYLDSLKYDLCSKKTFKPKLTYEANKDGYYPIDTTYKIRPDRSNKIKMTMISRTDYIHPLLVTNESASGLVSNVLDFIDLVILRSLLSDCILEYYSVNLQKFKNEYYITFKFDNKVVYNSLQLSKYDIAERLFDEVVRKILNPLNDNLGDSKQIFGYGLNIKAATKSFTNEDAVAESLVYDFYLPQNEVNSYKNLDITGQQLLDESIILLDGERIGLKLQ